MHDERLLKTQAAGVSNAVNAFVWSTDECLKIECISQSLSQLLACSPEHFIGLDLQTLFDSEIFHREDRPALFKAVEDMQQQAVPVDNLAHRVKSANGDWKWMAVSIIPLLDTHHQIRNLVGIMTDIDAQKPPEADLLRLNCELEQKLQRALAENLEKDSLLQQQGRMAALGETMGHIAHQWRQPLNSLAIILMDLEDGFLSGDASIDDVSRAVRRCNELLSKMSSTIDDFLNFFKKDKRLVKTAATDIVDEVSSLLQETLNRHRIDLKIHTPPSLAEAWAYPGELSQALLCLINNAKDQIVQQHVDRGEIVIDIGETPEWVTIRVSDNGGGIDEQYLPNIFDPYFTTKADGTGLGLYISKLTIEQSMHGRVFAENIAGGVRFTVLLPRVQP